MIISCGLPYEAIGGMLEKIDFGQVLNQGGFALFLVDYSLDQTTRTLAENQGFGLKTGSFPVDHSILVYPKVGL